MRRALTALITLVIIATCIGMAVHNTHKSTPVVNEEGLRHFLESQYVADVGLLRAATISYPDNGLPTSPTITSWPRGP